MITAEKLKKGELGSKPVATVKSLGKSGLCLVQLSLVAGATADVDYALPFPVRVLDAWLYKINGAGGGAGTAQVKNAANAITDAMSLNVADTTITRATQINDANQDLLSGSVRVTRTRTASTDENCVINLLCARL